MANNNKHLFDSADEEDELENDSENREFRTNKDYANSYNRFREKELLKKLKDKHSKNGNSSGSSSSSSDDDDSSDDTDNEFGDINNEKFDKQFFETLAKLKTKDPKIYDKNEVFFKEPVVDEEEEEEREGGDETEINATNSPVDNARTTKTTTTTTTTVKTKKDKALTVKDFERNVMLKKGGIYVDDIDEPPKKNKTTGSLPYVEQERLLKEEFKKILNSDDSSDENVDNDGGGDDDDGNNKSKNINNNKETEFGGVFKKRVKTKAEINAEEAKYTKWLAGEQAINIGGESVSTLKPLKEYWSNPKLSKDETFLRDYILNNGYKNRNIDEIPTYDEIVGGDGGGNNDDDDDDNESSSSTEPNIDLIDDEQEWEKQQQFEYKYNFRFEEPDQEFIKRYPRTIENSVRKTDDRRKLKRTEKKERKQFERNEKTKELEKLKELKRKEIEEKIETLKQVSGIDTLTLDDDDLDEDFDPDAYDRKMEKIFNNEYYQIDEGDDKPECPIDVEELQIEDWDNYIPEKYNKNNHNNNNELHCEDDSFNMDCDYMEENNTHNDNNRRKIALQNEIIESTRDGRKRRKRKSVFSEMLNKTKPIFDPNDEKTYGDYIDEYYRLDYEDIIAGDIKCRFKYSQTMPNDFGLSVEEILMAKNKELNQWASLKKAIQHRPEDVEKYEQKMFKTKGQNEFLKRKILKSIYESSSDEETTGNTDIETKTENLANSKKKIDVDRFKEKRKATTVIDSLNHSIEEPKIKKLCLNNKEIEKSPLHNKKIDSVKINNNKNKINDDKKLTINDNKKLKPNADKSQLNKTSNDSPSKLNNLKLNEKKSSNEILNDRKSNIEIANDIKTIDIKSKNIKLNDIKSNDKKSNIKISYDIKSTDNKSNDMKSIVQNNKSITNPNEKQSIKIPQTKNKSNSVQNVNKNKIIKKPTLSTTNNIGKNQFTNQSQTKNNSNDSSNQSKISDDRLRAFGINPKKFHNKIKYKPQQNNEMKKQNIIKKANQLKNTNGIKNSESIKHLNSIKNSPTLKTAIKNPNSLKNSNSIQKNPNSNQKKMVFKKQTPKKNIKAINKLKEFLNKST